MSWRNRLADPICAAVLASALLAGGAIVRFQPAPWSLLAISPLKTDAASPRVSAPGPAGAWLDLPCSADVTELQISGAAWSAGEAPQLLVSAFGPLSDPTAVHVTATWDASSAAPQGTSDNWQPWPEDRARPKASEPSVPARLQPVRLASATDLHSNSEVMENSLWPVGSTRLVDFLRPGQRGFSPGDFEQVNCEVVWVGQRCRLWHPSDETSDGRLEHWMSELGQKLDREWFPGVQARQGVWPDVDGDRCVNVLVTERTSVTSGGAQAYVRKADFTRDGGPLAAGPWDVIYLQPGGDLEKLAAILTHELTHVAQFSWCRQLCGDQPWPLPDWLTEGLAHAAESHNLQAVSHNTRPRLAAFCLQPDSSPLMVADAVASGLWRDPQQRGAAASFCTWWTSQQNDWSWPRLIEAHLQADDPWQAISAEGFTDLYRRWTLGLARDGVGQGEAHPRLPLQRQLLTAGVPRRVTLSGGATAYLKLPPKPAGNWRLRVSIKTAEQSPLQVSLLKIPKQTPGH